MTRANQATKARSIAINFRTPMIQTIMENQQKELKIKKVIASSINLVEGEDNMNTAEEVEEEATEEKEEEEEDMIEEAMKEVVMIDRIPEEAEAEEVEWAKINETKKHSVKFPLRTSSSVMKTSPNIENPDSRMITNTIDKTLVAMASMEKQLIKARNLNKMTMMTMASMTKRRRM